MLWILKIYSRGQMKIERYSSCILLVTMGLLLSIILPFSYTSGHSCSLTAEMVVTDAPCAFPGEISILTINVWSGLTHKRFFKMTRYQDDLRKRYKLLVIEIRKLDPDIIAIQEANPLPKYAQRLAADLEYQLIYRVALRGIRFGPLSIPPQT